MTLKSMWFQLQQLVQQFIKLLTWILTDIKRIYITLMLLLLYLSLYPFTEKF